MSDDDFFFSSQCVSLGVFQGETCLGSQPFAVTLPWDYSAVLFVFLLIRVSLCLSLSPAGVNDCRCLPEQDNLLSQLEPPADSCLAGIDGKLLWALNGRARSSARASTRSCCCSSHSERGLYCSPVLNSFSFSNAMHDSGRQAGSPFLPVKRLWAGRISAEGWRRRCGILGGWRHGAEPGERCSLPRCRCPARARPRSSAAAAAAARLGRPGTKWISNFIRVFVEDW